MFGAGGSADGSGSDAAGSTRIRSGGAESIFVLIIGLHCVPTSTYFTACVCTDFDANAGGVGFEGRREEDGEAGDE